jgi:hypothetical protein
MIPGPYAPVARIVEYDTATGVIRGVYEFPRDELNLSERKPREGFAFLEVHEPVDARTARVVDGEIAPVL